MTIQEIKITADSGEPVTATFLYKKEAVQAREILIKDGYVCNEIVPRKVGQFYYYLMTVEKANNNSKQ